MSVLFTVTSDEIIGSFAKMLNKMRVKCIEMQDGRHLDRDDLLCELIPLIDEWAESKRSDTPTKAKP